MILTAGVAIRFKGDNSDRMAAEFAESLRGRCIQHRSKVVMTKTTHVRVKMHSNGSEPPRPAIVNLGELRSDHE